MTDPIPSAHSKFGNARSETATSAFDRPAAFDPQRFAQPLAIDRGAPFWAWNGKLDAERLRQQFDCFAEMGLGGAHMHPRTGLATPYLGEEFLTHIEATVDDAAARGMHAWLYDEDRWPSGFAGGLATQDQRFWLRHIRISATPIAPGEARSCPTQHGVPLPLAERQLLAAWALRFDHNGLLCEHHRLASDEVIKSEAGWQGRYAYLEIPPACPWFNHTQYINTLDPQAMAQFIAVTHEQYYQRVGQHFGTTIPAIFTDEPLFRHMDRPQHADDTTDIFISWTDDLATTYQDEWDEDLWSVLPEILFDCANGAQRQARWRFHNHHTDRFVAAFAGQLGQWCDQHHIALTGHMMCEPTLGMQTTWIGEAMRSLHHFQLPGIDMLCDAMELTTAKQAQSVARQNGAPGVLSELYGVTNWDFPFAGHKRQGDWQAALGMITRVHHLSWYQMSGEAKRDYPASIGAHMPWHRRYPLIEDHFARLNAALRSGTPRCRVAMVHPIESFWLLHGPRAAEDQRQRLEQGFELTLRWLLEGLIDTDLVSEALLAAQVADQTSDKLADQLSEETSEKAGATADASLVVGDMRYEVVVVPPVLTLRRRTVEVLRRLIAAGGTVLLLDGGPQWIDAAQPIGDALAGAQHLAWERSGLLQALQPVRDLVLTDDRDLPLSGVIGQQRDLPDGERIVFVCRTDRDHDANNCTLRIEGQWSVSDLLTDEGTQRPRPATINGAATLIPVDLPVAGHVLLRLSPGNPVLAPTPSTTPHELARLPQPQSVELLEPNVLLLDQAAWRLNGGAWHDRTEVLRLDNAARAELGLPPRNGHIAQPWTQAHSQKQKESPANEQPHTIELAFTIAVTHATGDLMLALERADLAQVQLNGQTIDRSNSEKNPGHWIDPAFTTLDLPPLSVGQHRPDHFVAVWQRKWQR